MVVIIKHALAPCRRICARPSEESGRRGPRSLILPVMLCCLAAWSPGCATGRHEASLSPARPPALALSDGAPSGSLVVYSASDPGVHFDALAYRTHYSDYELQTAEGRPLERVHNDNDSGVGGPRALRLAPGRYRVVAHANGAGKVTVPVEIRANEVTTLHLDGGQTGDQGAQASRAQP